MVKALVLFSGGLDSRLTIKLLQEQDIEVEAVFFLLPFSKQEIPELKDLANINLHLINCTKGKMLREYLEIIKKPKYKTGAGINPCIDCRIFLLKKAKQVARKIKADFIATGEVLGERPMSQHKNTLSLIEKEAKLQNKVLRLLSAKLLPETEAEKKKLVNRNKLLDIQGRNRKKQIELAKRFKISYPSPGGGCLLCEKALAPRFKFLLGKNLINEKTLSLAKLGRHFYKQGWIVVGRNEEENTIIEGYENVTKSEKGKPAVYFYNKKNKKTAEELQKAYGSKDLNLRKEFEKYKL